MSGTEDDQRKRKLSICAILVSAYHVALIVGGIAFCLWLQSSLHAGSTSLESVGKPAAIQTGKSPSIKTETQKDARSSKKDSTGNDAEMPLLGEFTVQYLCLAVGAVAGAVTASRYVVLSLRHGKYETRRVAWQLLTPIYASVLSWIGIIAIRGGVLTLGEVEMVNERKFSQFAVAFSFLVGLCSESFVKRMIKAAETLFGERDPDQGKDNLEGDT